MAPLKRDAVAALVRDMITDGTLKPGGAVPSGSALATQTGYSPITCRQALRDLLTNGTLTRGVSRNARLRVAPADGAPVADADALRESLSATLAARRRAEGLTQPELAARLGVSPTTIGHAETGRVWQSRDFWWSADAVLGGELLRRYDEHQAAAHRPAATEAAVPATPEKPAPPPPVLPASVTITPDGVAVTWSDGSETWSGRPASRNGKQGVAGDSSVRG